MPTHPNLEPIFSTAHICGIDSEKRSHINTDTAAFYLNRKPQTLRIWACYQNGPIRPARVNKRLAWPVDQIRNLLKNGT